MSFPAYPDDKDSGVPWLGAVPRHWSIQRVKQNSYVKGRVGWKGLTSDEYLDEGYAYLVTGTDFRSKAISWADCYCVDQQRYEDDPFIQLRNGDLLITKDGTIGKLSLVTGLDRPACLNSGIFLVRPLSAYSTEFLYWVLASKVFGHFCDLLSTGSTIQHLYQNVFENFAFPIPTPAEQAAIAAFLDRETGKIDTLVAEQERLIALLKEKRQAVISHAVTKGLKPDAPMKDSGIEWLGEIPAHWEVSRLDRLMSFSSGKAHEPFIDADGEHIYISARFVSTQGQSAKRCTENLTPAFPGDIVMVMSDLPNGRALARAYQIPDDGNSYAVNQRVCRLSGVRGSNRYFLHQLNRNEGLLWYNDGVNQTHLSNAAYCKLELCNPPLEEQQEIADYLDEIASTFDLLTIEAQAAITLLQERRAALISAAVTGKIDVRSAATSSNVVPIKSAAPAAVVPTLRAVVGAYAIQELGPMGRMVVMKAGFLAEAHAGFSDLNGRYERFAAGPYDRTLLEAMEHGALQLCGIVTHEPRSAREAVTYEVPSTAIAAPGEALRSLVGEDAAARLREMLSLLKGIGREGVEAVATTYAVWNDLLAAGHAADDQTICRGVLTDWHPEKAKKFKPSDLDHWLAWMRRHQFVPDGTAPRTDNQPKLFQ